MNGRGLRIGTLPGLGGLLALISSSALAQPNDPPPTEPPAAAAAQDSDEPEAVAPNAATPDAPRTGDPGGQAEAATERSKQAATNEREHQHKQPVKSRSKTEKSPYAGLDHTGTPPKPALRESKSPPTEWREDYDGRPEGTPAEEVLIWIPRAPLLPVHLVLDYMVRRPLVAGIALAEENHVFERIVRFFTWDDGNAGIFPTAFYDAGRGFWAGGNFFWDGLGVREHSVRATAGIGTHDWLFAGASDAWKIFNNDSGTLVFAASYTEDPTFTFTGVGPETSLDDQVFFGQDRIDASTSLRVALEGLNRFNAELAYRRVELGSGRNPSIDATGSPFTPGTLRGFDDPYNVFSVTLGLEVDTRHPEREYSPGSGFRLDTWGSYNFGPEASGLNSSKLSYFRYAARPGFFLDFSGVNHVLSASIYAEAISKLGEQEALPVSELVTLGGDQILKGFNQGRARGDSAFVYSASYTWPVLFFLDGVLFAELGNVFNGFFQGFQHKRMLLDWGVGIRTSISREWQFNLLSAFGTNRVEEWSDDFEVDEVRFLVGTTYGF